VPESTAKPHPAPSPAMVREGEDYWLSIGTRAQRGRQVPQFLGTCDFCGDVQLLEGGPYENLVCTTCSTRFVVLELGGFNPNRNLPVATRP
jgi:hypothetical protein